MIRHSRFQGAAVRDHHILVIRQRWNANGPDFWVVPGGTMEPGETEEECVRREIKEETDLDVRVVSLLLDEKGMPGGVYQRLKTYLCEPIAGEARPGCEPDAPASLPRGITEVRWFDLTSEANWDPKLITDPFTYSVLQRVRRKLGYLA